MRFFIKFLALFFMLTTVVFGANKKIIIDLTKQEVYAYENGKLVYDDWISSGRKNFETPTGRYRVLQKSEEHISTEWPSRADKLKNKKRWSKEELKEDGGAKMPYMMRLTWSGISLHEGYVPNGPSSHGCIHVRKGFAKKLYKWASVGTRIIVRGKAPYHVARVKKRSHRYLAKKKTHPRRKLTKKRRLILKYAKLTHKRLNRILRKEYHKKNSILASKMSKWRKVSRLKKIKNFVSVILNAKHIKYAARKGIKARLQKLKVKRRRV